MAKFNLKEHIAKNKATFFGSLTEGQFSWMTQDTGQQIGSQEGNTIPVYMFDDKGKYWFEPSYDGYGVFGGMDYYELLDQMNGGRGDRREGIRKAFDPTTKGETLFPALVVGASNFNYKTHDFTQEAEHDPNQSWLPYEEEDINDDFGSDEDDMMEGYDEFKRVEKGKKKTVAKDKGEEDVYGAGVKKGEEIEKKKLKEAPINKEAIAKKIANFLQIPVEKLYGFELDGTDDIEELMASIVPQEKLNNPEKKYQIQRAIETFIEPFNTTGPSSDEVYPYGYGRGQGFGKSYENKTTMKKSELKAKIKEMIVAEMELDVEDSAKEDSLYDPVNESSFLAELENMLNEAEGLTPLQDYVYQYEIEISGEDRAQEFLDDIKRLNTPDDVYDYYAYERDWSGSMDDDLNNIFRQVSRKFKNLKEASEFDTNKPARIAEFITALNRLVDDYHAELYLNDDLFAAIEMVIKAAKEEATNLNEAEGDTEKDTAETDTETTTDTTTDTETTDVTTTAEVDPNVKAVQDSLTQAQAAAQQLGDAKLLDQIGNTITFFTRTHVVEKPGTVAESIFPMLKKILK